MIISLVQISLMSIQWKILQIWYHHFNLTDPDYAIHTWPVETTCLKIQDINLNDSTEFLSMYRNVLTFPKWWVCNKLGISTDKYKRWKYGSNLQMGVKINCLEVNCLIKVKTVSTRIDTKMNMCHHVVNLNFLQ